MAKPTAKRKGRRGGAVAARPLPSGAGSLLDLEALGLIVLAVGLVLAAIMYAPPQVTGALGELRALLVEEAGIGAYLLPIPPLALGGLLFMRRLVRAVWQITAGALLIACCAIIGVGIFEPELAGGLALAVADPARQSLGVAALVPLAVVASLGADLAIGFTPTTVLRGFFRLLLRAVLRIVRAFRVVFGAAGDTARRARSAGRLRAALEAHLVDLESLQDLYPAAAELGKWREEGEQAITALGRLDEAGIEHLQEDVAEWGKVVLAFSREKAGELANALGGEDAGAGPVAEEARRLVSTAAKVSGPATRALEDVRRSLLLDASAVLDAYRREKRERDAALKTLTGPIRPAELAQEIERHGTRAVLSQELRSRADALVDRANGFAGWPVLAARIDATPGAEALAGKVAAALAERGADALPELPDFERVLSRVPVVPDPRAGWEAVAGTPLHDLAARTPAATPKAPAVVEVRDLDQQDDGYDEDQPADPESFEAVFEIDLPQENARGGTQARPEDRPPWVAPAAGQANEEGHKRPASSAVGERVHAGQASSVPGLGGIPIQLPGGQFLDPVTVSSLDTLGIEKMARARAHTIDETLSHFGLQAKVVDYARGPTVTRYELEPAPGEKIARIASLQNDLARVLAVGGVRIEAPVPGKNVIGLEVPNQEREPVTFRAGVEDPAFKSGKTKLPLLLGKSIDGEMVVGDLGRMPHLLIAGSTGSGKSVCVNTLIMSLIYRFLPTQLRFVMVDPKMVELTPYDGIPHLVRPVVTNPADAAGVLLGCVAHMERRYKMMSSVGAKNLEQYNQKAREVHEDELPYVVIIIDELADLMITSPKEVESGIMRLAQMARATGMHLVLATQRPSVDILTSLIKVNVPARVAFAVSSGHDSRTILDTAGAERLTGYGDMLFYQPGLVKPMRLQGPYISEGELARITEYLRRQYFDDDFGEAYGTDFDGVFEAAPSTVAQNIDFSDPLIKQAAEIVIEEGYASVSRLQRRLSVGHARAGKLVDALEAMKIVGPHVGSKAREVLITREMLPEYFG